MIVIGLPWITLRPGAEFALSWRIRSGGRLCRIEPDQLRAPRRPGSADQQQGAVALGREEHVPARERDRQAREEPDEAIAPPLPYDATRPHRAVSRLFINFSPTLPRCPRNNEPPARRRRRRLPRYCSVPFSLQC